MLFVPLPTPRTTESVYPQRTQLDGAEYRLRFAHSSRTDSWTLDIDAVGANAASGTAIITGKKLRVGLDLLRYSRHPLRPPGRLFLLRFNGSREMPAGDTLHRYRLVYLSLGEQFG